MLHFPKPPPCQIWCGCFCNGLCNRRGLLSCDSKAFEHFTMECCVEQLFRLPTQNRAQSMMSLQARKAAEMFESQSPRAFSDYLRDFGQTADMHFSLYRPDGSDVLGTPTDGSTRLWISQAGQDDNTHF